MKVFEKSIRFWLIMCVVLLGLIAGRIYFPGEKINMLPKVTHLKEKVPRDSKECDCEQIQKESEELVLVMLAHKSSKSFQSRERLANAMIKAKELIRERDKCGCKKPGEVDPSKFKKIKITPEEEERFQDSK